MCRFFPLHVSTVPSSGLHHTGAITKHCHLLNCIRADHALGAVSFTLSHPEAANILYVLAVVVIVVVRLFPQGVQDLFIPSMGANFSYLYKHIMHALNLIHGVNSGKCNIK